MVDQSDGRDRGWNNEHATGAGQTAGYSANPATGAVPQNQPEQPDAANLASNFADGSRSPLHDDQIAAPANEQSEPVPAATASETASFGSIATDNISAPRTDEFAPQTSAAAGPSLSASCTQEYEEGDPWPQPRHFDVYLGTASAEPTGETPSRQSIADPAAPDVGGEMAIQAAAEEPKPLVEVDEQRRDGETSVPAPNDETAAPRPTSGSFAGFDADAYGLPMASLNPGRAMVLPSEEVSEEPRSDAPEAGEVQPASVAQGQTEGSGFVMREADPVEPAGEETDIAPQDSLHENIPTAEPASQEATNEQADPIVADSLDKSQDRSTGTFASAETSLDKESDYSESSLPVWEAVAAEMAAALDTDPSSSNEGESSSLEAPANVESVPVDEWLAPDRGETDDGPEDKTEPDVTMGADDSDALHAAGEDLPSAEPVAAETAEPAGVVQAEDSQESDDEPTDVDLPAPVDAPPVLANAPETEADDATVTDEIDGKLESDKSSESSQRRAESEATDEEGNDKIESTTDTAEDEVRVAPDPEGAFSYLVSDARFEVVDGELRLKDGISLDAKREPTIDVLVATIDAEGDSLAENYTVVVEAGGSRPAPIPLNDPTEEESEWTEDANAPACEEAATDEARALDPVDEEVEEISAPNQAPDVTEAPSRPDSEKPAAAADEPKAAVSVRSIEETFLVDASVEASDAGHDFLMLGSEEEAGEGETTAETASQSDTAQPGETGIDAGNFDVDVVADVEGGAPTEHASAAGSGDAAQAQEFTPDPDPVSEEIAGVSGRDRAQDDAEWEAFLFEPKEPEQDSDNPAAEDADTLDLSEVAEGGRSWTILLNDGSEIRGTGEDYLDLTEDASGTITFDDGTEMTFDSVERVTW